MVKTKRYIIRDLVVYCISAIITSLKERNASIFFKDIIYFFHWWKYRKNKREVLAEETPWLVFSAIDFLKQYLKKEMKVFEYGSGGSTIFFARRIKKIVSIEHDEEWYRMVKEYISQRLISNIDYYLVVPTDDINNKQKDATNPDHFISTRSEYKEKSFEKYAKQISSYDDNFFDLIVIDGRVRASCIKQSIPKIKKMGILLLDNADRSYYLKPFPELMDSRKWKIQEFQGHFPLASASELNKTIIFQRLI